jgi:hypothetical protein
LEFLLGPTQPRRDGFDLAPILLRMAVCTHLDAVELLDVPANVAGCEECLAGGGRWLHLRMCQTCGHIGCCDNSPGRHATAHHAATGHPIVRSAEPGEDWSWCYEDGVMFRLEAG